MKRIRRKLGLAAFLFVLTVLGCLTVHAAVISPKEVSATATSATVTWDAVSGARWYEIIHGKYTDDQSTYRILQTTGNTYTFSNLQPDVMYSYVVAAYDASGQRISTLPTYYSTYYATPSPIKSGGIKCDGWRNTTGYFSVTPAAKVTGPSSIGMGVEWEVWNRTGKKRMASGSTTLTSFYATLKRNQTYQLRVRVYYSSSAGRIVSPWTSKLIVPEPVQKKPVGANGNTAFKLRWAKVAGATKYLIYVSTSSSSGYKKIATVGSGKNSYVFSRYKGRSLEKYKTYYFKVYAVKGKTKCTSSSYTYGYLYTVYR